MISVDNLYGEFTRNAVELVNYKDRGYGVFFGMLFINDIAVKCLLRFRDTIGNLWDNLEYMKIIAEVDKAKPEPIGMYNDYVRESFWGNRTLYVDSCQSRGHDSLDVLFERTHPIEYPIQQEYT